MTFEEAYRELERDFRDMVEKDNRDHGFKSIYLPNVPPQGPVDFVLVGMEPSLGHWARPPKKLPTWEEIEQYAAKRICQGFRNFGDPPEKSILPFCISKYLCRKGETYYFTDLAHGAMKGNPGNGKTAEKYERWYPLFMRELGLVAKPDAKIISMGRTVSRFLSEKGLYGHAGTVPHHSLTGAAHFGKEIPGREECFRRFCEDASNFPCKVKMTDAKRKLIFDCKISFGRIREQKEQGWLSWSRDWQHHLGAI